LVCLSSLSFLSFIITFSESLHYSYTCTC
jgi:hypothetical protein